jgi:CheY-like chemotaxis protein
MMSKRILLIDDDELLCEVLVDFLELSGYAVTTAGNGRHGLDRLADNAAFDLILLDLVMAEMDGIRFLKAFEQLPGKRPPVMVLSASATADVVDALDFPDVVGVERKPIRPEALLERIAAVLGAG